ncbi:MAG: pilus assembly protein [Anaerolineales bacterium]|nr:pilus assembly protein [Anaerolineales bacterium]
MPDLLQKLRVRAKSAALKYRPGRRVSTAQSLVELAITLPVLILLFSGMVEFGFMLNTYLSLQDATRAAARRYSNENPFAKDINGNVVDDAAFYSGAAQAVVDFLMPPDDSAARQTIVDPTRDNVLISVITIRVDEAPEPDAIDSITRHPDGEEYYKLYGDTNPITLYGNTEIEQYATSNGSVPVDAGLLIVEIFYSYEGVLHLPWTEPFFSEANPAMLYNSTIMPLVSAKP